MLSGLVAADDPWLDLWAALAAIGGLSSLPV